VPDSLSVTSLDELTSAKLYGHTPHRSSARRKRSSSSSGSNHVSHSSVKKTHTDTAAAAATATTAAAARAAALPKLSASARCSPAALNLVKTMIGGSGLPLIKHHRRRAGRGRRTVFFDPDKHELIWSCSKRGGTLKSLPLTRTAAVALRGRKVRCRGL
jgi:hypothetical protein